MSTEVLSKVSFFLREFGVTPTLTGLDNTLVQAAFSGDLGLVQWLLSEGARVDYWQDQAQEDNMEEHIFKSSAMLVACQQGHLDIVICLHQGIKKKSKRASSRDGLRHYWPILVETLRNRDKIMGQRVTKDIEGLEINLDVDPFLQPYCYLDDLRLLQYLIDAGADLNTIGISGKTPLIKAATSPRYSKALEMMLHGGADPNFFGKQHHSSLVCAAKHGNIDAMRMLLNYGAHLHCTFQGVTVPTSSDSCVQVCQALVFSIAQGDLQAVQLLIAHGARPTLIPRFLLYKLQILEHGDLTGYTDCVSYLYLALYSLQPHIAHFFLEIAFYDLRDLPALQMDTELLRKLEFEGDEEFERSSLMRGLSSSPSQRGQSGGPQPQFGTEAGGRAATSLQMFHEIVGSPPTLFSLALIEVRRSCDMNSQCQEKLEDPQFRLSLRLPRPLFRKLLYSAKEL